MTITLNAVAASFTKASDSFTKAAEGIGKIEFPDSLTFVAVPFEECQEKPTIDYLDLPPLETEKVVDRFRREVRAVVNEVGQDYKCPLHPYEHGDGFYYVWDGEPDCLVGRVLHRMGVPIDVLSDHEHNNATVVLPAVWSYIGNSVYEDMGPVMTLALNVQRVNDGNIPWGFALQF